MKNITNYNYTKTKKNLGFTLVELIVTLTIIMILWVITFISMQGYNKSARDSARISDISVIKTSLEIFHVNSWKFPEPTSWFNIYYSWSIVWNQWIIWKQTITNLTNLDKIPTDPLTNNEYTYSVTKNKQEYELAWLSEWTEIVSKTNIINNTFAWDTIATAMVEWNYNWVLFKTETWSNCEILSIPSIISSQDSSTQELITILSEQSLVFNWFNNLPPVYKNSKYKTDGWFLFESKKLIVYSDNQNCIPLTSPENDSARIKLIQNLQTAYSWTIIAENSHIKKYIQVNISDSKAITELSKSVVNNSLWWKLYSNSKTLTCLEWTHSEDWITCIDNEWTCEIENWIWRNLWNWTEWDCSVNTCDSNFYNPWNNTCIEVWIWFYSNNNWTREECTNYPDTLSRDYTYTSNWNWTNNCSATYQPLCWIDLYESWDWNCIDVWTGYYSPINNNSIISCTNKPSNSTYTWDWNWTNNCSFTCNPWYSLVSWVCQLPMLYWNNHTEEQCWVIWWSVQVITGWKLCRISSSSTTCPSWWSHYSSRTITSSKTCTRSRMNDTSCTTWSHSWSNKDLETCSYIYHWRSTTCYGNYTQIWCF